MLISDWSSDVCSSDLPFDAGEAASPLAVADRLHRADQGLRRHTAYIDAGPSDDAMADEGDLGARFRRSHGGREPGGTGTNHRQIVSLPRGTIGEQCRRHDTFTEALSWPRSRTTTQDGGPETKAIHGRTTSSTNDTTSATPQPQHT